MKKMRFLIISDGHGDLDILDKLDSEFEKSDVVLFGKVKIFHINSIYQ